MLGSEEESAQRVGGEERTQERGREQRSGRNLVFGREEEESARE